MFWDEICKKTSFQQFSIEFLLYWRFPIPAPRRLLQLSLGTSAARCTENSELLSPGLKTCFEVLQHFTCRVRQLVGSIFRAKFIVVNSSYTRKSYHLNCLLKAYSCIKRRLTLALKDFQRLNVCR